jgi:hypothetical protein
MLFFLRLATVVVFRLGSDDSLRVSMSASMAFTLCAAESSWPVSGSRWMDVRGPAKRSVVESSDSVVDASEQWDGFLFPLISGCGWR